MSILGFLSGALKPVSDAYSAGQRRKQAKETGLNEIKKAQVDGENNLNLTDAQWEAISVSSQDASWKDEYVTVTMTAWIWLALVGAVMSAYDKPEVLNGVKTFVEFCTSNSIDLGLLTKTVVAAAVGLKLWRGR